MRYSIISTISFAATIIASPIPQNTNPLNGPLAMLFMSPLLGKDVTQISGALTILEATIAKSGMVDTEQSAVADGKCADMMIVFARGTTEPGNVGLVTGPQLLEAVQKAAPSGKTVAMQGVDNYPASIVGYLSGGDTAGSQSMADSITRAQTLCPQSAIIVSGYSQGAQLVHNAAKLLPAETMSKVSSVVTFGDPNQKSAVANVDASRAKVYCHVGDSICEDGDLILLQHLTYGTLDADDAAGFMVRTAYP